MKQKTTLTIITLVIIVGIGVAALSRRDATSQLPSSVDGIWGLRFQDYDGTNVSLADFAGIPLVVNSWAAWCPFCRKELSDFASVQREFGEQVRIIAINRQESLATAQKYSDELGVTDDLVMLLDDNDSFYRAIGGFAMPETIFIDGSGVVVEHKRGPMPLMEIREKIETIIAQ